MDMVELADNGREYFGQFKIQMPVLLEDGKEAISVTYAMLKRLGDNEESEWYRDNYLSTRDSIVVPREGDYDDGRFKICLNSPRLRALNAQSSLKDGGLTVDYGKVEGIELRRSEVKLNVHLSESEAREHRGWFEILGQNQSFLDAIVGRVFYEGRQKYNTDKMMAFYIEEESKFSLERAACVYSLEVGSLLYGRLGLFDVIGRLVGVAPEALLPQRMNLEIAREVEKHNAWKNRIEQTDKERIRSGEYTPEEIKRLQFIKGGVVVGDRDGETEVSISVKPQIDYLPLEIGCVNDDSGYFPRRLADERIIPLGPFGSK